ncbi:hypothetical protein [Streptomyces sp. NPDC058295]|uniref:hypothetical protein n=1 Tax=Streptomyces sp. NPDC058295 TaxID=3346431 RepID=UPI0036EFDD57
MSEWNLSVRLTGQGSGLARTLRDLSRDADRASTRVNALRRDIDRLRADTRNPIRVRIDVDAGHLRSDVRAALTSAGAGQGLRVRLDLDADHLRGEVRAALTTAGAGQGMSVNLRLGNSMQLRREVEAAVRWAAWGHRIEIPIGLADPMQLRRDVSAAVRWASMNQTVRVRVVADTSALTTLGSTVGGGSSNKADFGLNGLLGLATAAIPLVAGLSTSLAPLPGMFAAGGTAAAAFGIAIAGQIEPLSQVADAQKKYEEAVRDNGRSSKEAMQAQLAYQKMLTALPPATQSAAIALAGLKQDFSEWSDSMAGFTMVPVTKGITILDTLIPRLTPHVQSASSQLDRLLTVAGGAVNTPGFDAMAKRFETFSGRQLDEMTDKVIHFMRVLSEGDVGGGGAIQEFMAYAKENGPAAREAISAISAALVTLLRGAAEAGPSMLTLVTAAAKLVSALPPELVGIIIQVATALKLLQLSGAGMAALAGGVAAVSTRITALTAVSTAAGGGLAGLRAAFMSLGVAARTMLIGSGIGILLVVLSQLSEMSKKAPPDVDKLTTSMRSLASTGQASGEAARVFGKDLSGLADALQKVKDPKGLDQVQQSIVSFFGTDSTPIADAKKDIDALDKSLAGLVKNGQADLAAASLEQITQRLKKQGHSAKEIKSQLDDYKSALADAAFEQEMAAEAMGVFGSAAQDTQSKLDAQKASADGLRQSIQALNDVNRAAGSAMSAFEESVDNAIAAAKDHAGTLKMTNGELNLGSEKARESEKALSDLAADTDAAAAAAREQGKSWGYVQGIMTRGQKTFSDAAQKMGLTKEQADALAQSYISIPDSKTTLVEMRTEDAISGLTSVIEAIQKTPDAKSVTVKALTDDAILQLTELGFSVTTLKDGSFKVTANTATAQEGLTSLQAVRDGLKDKTIKLDTQTADAITDLEAVQAKVKGTNGKTITMKAPTAAAREQLTLLGFKIKDTKGKNVQITVPTGTQRANVGALAATIAGLRDRSITITTSYVIKGNPNVASGTYLGSTAGRSADGNIYAGARVQRFASGGMRENHVAQIARPQPDLRIWAEPETQGEAYVPFAPSKRVRSRAITEEVVRRLGGDPASIQWNANGSVTDWRYDPQTGSLYSPSDAGQAGNKTRKVKGKEVAYFDIGAVEKKIKSASMATNAWNKDLEKVADRVGGDVAEALASMGEEGRKLADKMANGSTKYINDMASALRNLQSTAKASLTDYTRQLTKANTLNKTFSDNLATLAAQGFGDLAGQLASQNDEAAQQLAAAAVKDKGKATSANAQAKAANTALTSEQVSELVQIIAAISTSTTGIHDVAGKTGLGEDEIISVATKAKTQITKSLGSRATKFLTDLGRAGQGLSYANGGIRAGMYATQGGIIRFAEPETHGEALIPLGPNKRRAAMPVLADVAHRFGVGITDAAASRPVVIVQGSGDTHVSVTAVRSGATASDIGSQVGRSVRRARRGGVAARAGS